jgi:hypothetical protein
MEKWQNFDGTETLEELSTTAEEIASDEPGFTAEEVPSSMAEDAGMSSGRGDTVEESSSQPSTKAQPITETAYAKILTQFFIRDSPFFV